MNQPPFDPGLTQQVTGRLRRAINHDGSFNVRHSGRTWRDTNIYLHLISVRWPRYLVYVLTSYLVMNCLFAVLYVVAGTENLIGAEAGTGLNGYLTAFFFSAQTLTTVGYGHIAPKGLLTSSIAAFEAMVGVMAFAVATGVLYGRVSKPSARIRFASNMLMAPYQGGSSLQFRMANGRSNVLMELDAKVLWMTVEQVNGEMKRSYADLKLERSQVYFFPLTWTVVHPIDEQSPLYGKTPEDLAKLQGEALILIKAFDDTFSQTVHARYSYRHDEIVWNARYSPAFRLNESGDMVLEMHKLNDHVTIDHAKLP